MGTLIIFIIQQLLLIGAVISNFFIDNIYLKLGIMITCIIIMTVIFIKKINRIVLEAEKVVNYLNIEKNHNIYLGKNNTLLDNIRNILKNFKESSEREHSAEILRRQAEIAALQSQINPHFLYNTLDAVRGQALFYKINEIAEMIEALSRYFRYNISKKGDFVTLEEEIENISNYIYIQQYRFTDKFSFTIKYNEDDKEIINCLIPKLTIQPIIENCIYHGLEPKMEKGKITIRISFTNKKLIIIVTDDGVGMSDEELEKFIYKLRHNFAGTQSEGVGYHTGIGLLNVNQRLKLLFGEEYGLSIFSTKGLGTEVEISLPVVKGQQELHKIGVDNNKN
jgi:Putative regulator of cell autolysis